VTDVAGTNIKTWVETLARDLVDHTGAVSVGSFEDDGVLVFELTVDPSELGRVIGRQGRTVQAMRTLLEAAGARDGQYYELEIVE
jgi:predicted RNA-binding protein YlqC (UPF0109 family)